MEPNVFFVFCKMFLPVPFGETFSGEPAFSFAGGSNLKLNLHQTGEGPPISVIKLHMLEIFTGGKFLLNFLKVRLASSNQLSFKVNL